MAHDDLAEHAEELLAPLGTVRRRRMFGGHGLYVDGCFLALIAGGRLYLKASPETRAHFEAAGCEAFRYEARGRWHQLLYYTVPADAMESPALMLPWARLALQAAWSARAAAKPASPRPPRVTPKTPARTTRTKAR